MTYCAGYKSKRNRGAFTLVELLVVLALTAAAATMAVVGLDGVSRTARLRATGNQLISISQLASSEARMSGAPRLVTYLANRSSVVVSKPHRSEEGIMWDQGEAWDLTSNVRIERILVEGQDPSEGSEDETSIRVRTNGSMLRHAMILDAADRFAVVRMGGTSSAEVRLLSRRPTSTTYELLEIELESIDDPA